MNKKLKLKNSPSLPFYHQTGVQDSTANRCRAEAPEDPALRTEASQ